MANIEGSVHSDSLLCQDAKYCQIYNNMVVDSEDQNIYIDTFSAIRGGPIRVYNNVTVNGAFGLVLHAETGSLGIDDIVVANNTFYHMNNCAIRQGGGSPALTNLVLLNNYYGKADYSGYGLQIDIHSNATFASNSSWDYGVYATGSTFFPKVANWTGQYTLAQLKALSQPREANGKVGDPSFVNASVGDLRLSSSDIVAKGAARNLYSQYPFLQTDKDGNARPSSGAWDIGAYQYSSEETPDTTPPAAPTNVIVN